MQKSKYLGNKYGRLMVIMDLGTTPKTLKRSQRILWAMCNCGVVIETTLNKLVHGKTKSCGCLATEWSTKGQITHGMSKTRLYSCWHGMKDRCYKNNGISNKWYKINGISVCDEWRDDFLKFFNWALESGYKDDLQLDRINNNGNYEPNNCRWVTRSENQNNKRNNVYFEYGGKRLTIAQWARETGFPVSSVRKRLNKRGSPYPLEGGQVDKVLIPEKVNN